MRTSREELIRKGVIKEPDGSQPYIPNMGKWLSNKPFVLQKIIFCLSDTFLLLKDTGVCLEIREIWKVIFVYFYFQKKENSIWQNLFFT